MFPRKDHLKMINDFHDRLEEVDNKLDNIRKEYGDDTSKYTADILNRTYNLSSEYYQLTAKIWPSIDNFLEYEVKEEIEILKMK